MLPILLFGSECWTLTKVQSQKLERVHSSCLRSILGVRLSDRHTNEHIRKSCGVATLSAYITANRLRWLGHVGRMEEGRLPHIALFSSLHGDMTRPVGRPRHTWEKCVCADLKVLGQDEGSWEASCQIKSAWRKRLWDSFLAAHLRPDLCGHRLPVHAWSISHVSMDKTTYTA